MKKPQPFGKYLLLDRINVGGMAEVFLAKTFGVEGFERIMAIKKIIPTMVEDEEFINMFIDEARIAVQLNHANIVQIHELGKQDEHYYIAMEYVSGRDVRILLDAVKKKKQTLPLPLAAYVVHEVCEGLDYAHRKKDSQGRDMNIVHRDVSPQNVLISYDGTVKVIDFGIAKAQNRIQKTQAGILKGKFGYMSPEQVRGLPIDRRSDIFALGVILYEMLTGERLFMGESDFSTLEKVRNAEVLPPREYNDQIPEELEKVVMKSLTREPNDRYQWAGEMGEDLMRFLVQGDMVFSQKQLAGYMADFFAPEIVREQDRMTKFAAVQRPEGTPISSPPPPPAPPPPASPSQPPTAPQIRSSKTIEDLPALHLGGEEEEPGERTQLYDPVFASPGAPTPAGSAPSDGPSGPHSPVAKTIEFAAVVGVPTILNMPAVEAVTTEGQTVIKESSLRPTPAGIPSETPAEGKTVIKVEPSLPKVRLSGPLEAAKAGLDAPAHEQRTDLSTEETDERTGPALPRAVRLVPDAPHAPPALRAARKPLAFPALKAIGVGVAIGAVLVVALIVIMALFRRPPAAELATLVISPEPAEGTQISVDGRQLTEAEHHTFVARELTPGEHLVEAKNAFGTRMLKVSMQAGETKPLQMAAAEATPAPPAPTSPAVAVAPSGPEAPSGAPTAVPSPPTAPDTVPAPKMGLDLSATPHSPRPPAAPVQITIATDPTDAEIFVDRQSVGHAPYLLTSTDPDHLYRLKATAPGRRSAEKTARFSEGQTVTLVLREASTEHVAGGSGSGSGGGHHRGPRGGPPGTLIISSRPVAKVFIDGRSTERYTPIAPSDPLEIPSGDHLIHFESDDGKKADRQVSIQPHTLTRLTGVTLN